jgi:hypothetical protein
VTAHWHTTVTSLDRDDSGPGQEGAGRGPGGVQGEETGRS